MNWLADNSGAIQAVTGILTMLVWVVYLHALLMNYARQRRPEILITYGAGKGLASHCFVTNLGLEPIYLLDAVIEVYTREGSRTASIIDRTEEGEAVLDPACATNQGPLPSAGFRDIGSFRSLLDRAKDQDSALPSAECVCSIEITIIAATAAQASLAGARRRFMLERGDTQDSRTLIASADTRQIRTSREFRRLRQCMDNTAKHCVRSRRD
jgi:hypothetical protein